MKKFKKKYSLPFIFGCAVSGAVISHVDYTIDNKSALNAIKDDYKEIISTNTDKSRSCGIFGQYSKTFIGKDKKTGEETEIKVCKDYFKNPVIDVYKR